MRRKEHTGENPRSKIQPVQYYLHFKDTKNRMPRKRNYLLAFDMLAEKPQRVFQENCKLRKLKTENLIVMKLGNLLNEISNSKCKITDSKYKFYTIPNSKKKLWLE